jgi:hypothetical protein
MRHGKRAPVYGLSTATATTFCNASSLPWKCRSLEKPRLDVRIPPPLLGSRRAGRHCRRNLMVKPAAASSKTLFAAAGLSLPRTVRGPFASCAKSPFTARRGVFRLASSSFTGKDFQGSLLSSRLAAAESSARGRFDRGSQSSPQAHSSRQPVGRAMISRSCSKS